MTAPGNPVTSGDSNEAGDCTVGRMTRIIVSGGENV